MKKRILIFLITGLLGAAVVPTAESAAFGTIGTKVTKESNDFVPTISETLPTGIDAYLVRRQPDASTNVYYIHFDDNTDTAISNLGKTFRLTCGIAFTSSCPANAKAGTWVEAGDPDMATPTFTRLATIESRLVFLESDAKPGWSSGDGLYIDVLTGTTGSIDVGDVRIVKPTGFTCSTCPIGTVVKAGDTDLVEANDGDRVAPLALTYETATFKLFWFDGDNDATIGPLDALYAKGPNAPTYSGTASAHPDIGDGRFAEDTTNYLGSTVAFGTRVSSTAVDAAKSFAVSLQPSLVVANVADPEIPDRHLFLHFDDPDGADDHIRTGDFQLYKGPSGGGGGTLVSAKGTSATVPGHGTSIGSTVSFLSRVRFVDNGPSGFTPDDAVYLKHPSNAGANVEVNDFRLTAASVGSFAAGSLVKSGNTDVGQALSSSADFVMKSWDADGGSAVPLKTLTVKVTDGLGSVSGVWEPATEGLYISAASTSVVTQNDRRLYHPTESPGLVSCGTDADCADPYVASTKVRITGADAVYDVGSSESIYYSEDLFLGPGDIRVLDVDTLLAGTVVSSGDADAAQAAFTSGDWLLLAHDPACAAVCSPLMRLGDVFIYGQTFGARVTQTTTSFVPLLHEITGLNVVRYNRGSSTSAIDDTFYATFGGSSTLSSNDIRLTAIGSSTAGTLIKSTDSTFSEEVLGGSPFTLDSTDLTSRLCYVEATGAGGLSVGDTAYIQLLGTAFPGAPAFGSSATAVEQYDYRLNSYPAAGTQVEKAAALVLSGDSDLPSTCSSTTLTWFFRFFDIDGDGTFTSGGTSTANDDVAYLALGTTSDYAPPPLFATRLTGGGSSSTSGGGGGGGGGTTPPTTTPATTTIPVTTPIVTTDATGGTTTILPPGQTTSAAGTTAATTPTTSRGGSPGFELVFLVAAAAAAVLVLRRRVR